MKYLDADHDATNLQFKQSTLEDQAVKLEKQLTSAALNMSGLSGSFI